MLYIDLYRFAEKSATDYVPFDALSHRVVTRHERVGSLQLYPCDLDESVSLGHTVLNPDAVSEDGQTLDEVQIRYSRKLDDRESRIVWTKELMHVFDSEEALVDTSEKLYTLLTELETRPLHDDASPMLISENTAEWMAILVLCPLSLRNKHYAEYREEKCTIEDIAGVLRIPDWAVRSAMSPNYEMALRHLVGISATATRRRKQEG